MSAIAEEALTWLGTPWHHRGKIKGNGGGVDCASLLWCIYIGSGMVAPFPLPRYPAQWAIHRREEILRQIVEQHGDPVDEPLPGDVVLFKWGKVFSHGGIVIDWPFIVHTTQGSGVIKENIKRMALWHKDKLFYRVRNGSG